MGTDAWSQERVIGFVDISRAHPHADLHRKVFITVPSDIGGSRVKRLLKNLYGLKDAPQNFELKVRELMLALGATQGLFSPCHYLVGKLWVMVHGDDFFCLGTRQEVKDFAAGLGKDLIVKTRGILGPRKDLGDIQEIICLNRILRWIPATSSNMDKIEIEADARHANLILEHLGLKKALKV